SEALYAQFEKNPDETIRLDAFMERHDISGEWKSYVLPSSVRELNEDDSARLFANMDSKLASVPPDEQTRNLYHKVYAEVAERESLINNPSIMDVINEALRENPELSAWESVFPFFR